MEHARVTHQLSDALSGPWSWHWLPLALVAVSGLLYAAGLWRLWRKGALARALRWWEPVSFALGWLTIVVAQASPLAWLSEQLFAAHMTQHELLMLVAAPLLVLGRPLVVMIWAFSARGRARVASVARGRTVSRAWRLLTVPLLVWVLHAAALWLWHLPAWYQAALDNPDLHLLQHACFLGTAALFWWTLVHGRYGRMGYGVAVLFVFTTMLHSGLLGALFTFASTSIYPAYASTAPPWRLSALEDQQLAGLIMWIPFGVVFMIVALALFGAWLGESDRRLRLGRMGSAASADGRIDAV